MQKLDSARQDWASKPLTSVPLEIPEEQAGQPASQPASQANRAQQRIDANKGTIA